MIEKGRPSLRQKNIELDFGNFVLEAELFDSGIAKKFADHLPYTINLMQWGEEYYGSIGVDLGEENPVAVIPPGGLAYTKNGHFVCIFFGQRPAWAVEHIGRIRGDAWKKLLENRGCNLVKIRACSPFG